MQNHKILRIASPNLTLQNTLSKELDISCILAQILINRGINNPEEAEKFLNADLSHLLDPYSFSDMPKAVDIIKKANKHKKKVMIFGDYDVDGITAVTLMKNTLSKIGLDAVHYIPHRIKEGYGLTKNIIHLAKQKDIKLLITVDCGTNDFSQIRELRGFNIDVIITDHHEPLNKESSFPSAIINPKLKNSNYKYRDLSGVGVAYKLCQALSEEVLLDDLDLVSLGTVADAVPLTGENRIIVREGLPRISQTKRPGLKALIKTSGIQGKKVSPDFVGYILGPRINASGRIDTAEIALELLMSKKDDEAGRLATVIEAHNRQRQKIESKILEEAQDLVEKEINFKEHKILVLAKENWHPGVLGIVAAKLADRFYRPTIVISKTDNLCKGSGRSIKSFHMFGALLECKEFLKTFGGHSHAVGLIVAKNNIENFKNKINSLAKERLVLDDLLPTVDIDMELALADISLEIVSEFQALEPFGRGNAEPLFYTRGLKIRGEPQVLGRETLKFWVTDGQITLGAIGFGMAGVKESLIKADSFDLVYACKIDEWSGESVILLEAKDIFFR